MKILPWLSGLLLVVSGLQTSVADSTSMMIVPARSQAVLLGQDMAMLRDCNLVAFQGDASNPNPSMHAWYQKSWRGISIDVLGDRSSYEEAPSSIILFGHPNDIPASLINAARRVCSDVRHIPTLDLVTMISALNELYDFSDGEWKALARRYGLAIKDINENRRKYGRYGPPGGQAMSDEPQVNNNRNFDLEPQPLEPEPLAPEPVQYVAPKPVTYTPPKPVSGNSIGPGQTSTLEMDNNDPPPAQILVPAP